MDAVQSSKKKKNLESEPYPAIESVPFAFTMSEIDAVCSQETAVSINGVCLLHLRVCSIKPS
jgi:hypothetical protein